VLSPNDGKVGAVSLTAEGVQFVAGGERTRVALWEFAHAGTVKQLGECKARAEVTVMTPDGRKVAVGGPDGLYLGEVTPAGVSFRRLEGHQGPVHAIAMTPDGKTLASGSADGVTRIWALTSPADSFRELPGHKGAVSALAITPDGKTLATGGEDLTLRILDLSNPDTLPSIDRDSHASRISALRFGPYEGHFRLASASLDKILCWDSLNLDLEPTLLDDTNGARSLEFSPDGNKLAAGTKDGDVKIWELRLETLLGLAKRNVGRNFTREEWREFFPTTEYRKTFEDLP
jgi:WD40 repeat protein